MPLVLLHPRKPICTLSYSIPVFLTLLHLTPCPHWALWHWGSGVIRHTCSGAISAGLLPVSLMVLSSGGLRDHTFYHSVQLLVPSGHLHISSLKGVTSEFSYIHLTSEMCGWQMYRQLLHTAFYIWVSRHGTLEDNPSCLMSSAFKICIFTALCAGDNQKYSSWQGLRKPRDMTRLEEDISLFKVSPQMLLKG